MGWEMIYCKQALEASRGLGFETSRGLCWAMDIFPPFSKVLGSPKVSLCLTGFVVLCLFIVDGWKGVLLEICFYYVAYT